MLTLYFSPGASSMATHIALNEIGAPFELNYIPLHQHANREAGYLGVNPEGKVPTLMIDGRALTEVAATLWYLARRYPEAGLLRPRRCSASTKTSRQRSLPVRRAGWIVEAINDIHEMTRASPSTI